VIGKGDDGALSFGRHAINRVGAGAWCCKVRRDIVCGRLGCSGEVEGRERERRAAEGVQGWEFGFWGGMISLAK